MQPQSITRDLWNTVSGMEIGAQFTGPEIRAQYFKKVPYKRISSAIGYLLKKGILEKANTWDGENYLIYKVIDNSQKPRPINLDSPYFRAKLSGKKEARPSGTGKFAKGLFTYKKTNGHTITGGATRSLLEVVESVERQLANALDIATRPEKNLSSFSVKELLDEVMRREQR